MLDPNRIEQPSSVINAANRYENDSLFRNLVDINHETKNKTAETKPDNKSSVKKPNKHIQLEENKSDIETTNKTSGNISSLHDDNMWNVSLEDFGNIPLQKSSNKSSVEKTNNVIPVEKDVRRRITPIPAFVETTPDTATLNSRNPDEQQVVTPENNTDVDSESVEYDLGTNQPPVTNLETKNITSRNNTRNVKNGKPEHSVTVEDVESDEDD